MSVQTAGAEAAVRPTELTSQRRSDRRSRLIAAALDLFAERPYEDVSVDEICARAEVAHGLLSYHFGGKRGLFASAVSEAWAELVSYELPLPYEHGAAERVRGYLTRHFHYARQHPERFRIMMRTGHADEQIMEILRAARRNAVKEIASALGCPEGAPQRLRTAITGWTGFVDTVTLDYIDNDSLHEEDLTDLCTQVLVAAVRSATGVPLEPEVELEALSHVAVDFAAGLLAEAK